MSSQGANIEIDIVEQLMLALYKHVMLQQSRLKLESASINNSSFSSLIFVENNDGS